MLTDKQCISRHRDDDRDICASHDHHHHDAGDNAAHYIGRLVLNIPGIPATAGNKPEAERNTQEEGECSTQEVEGSSLRHLD
ncbi:hypothetical protein SAMN05216387_11823 [Nitrosovibrio tenuis]|uniref:Uncharacterized protein n=1 Tax=Nitrosovibrio tenuis TaxID=1233 RepID=A0A1H7RNK5_9PROT|nr:hypothetical protein SAMN05216387_11823 [Nitrosovibrio tenuis]